VYKLPTIDARRMSLS